MTKMRPSQLNCKNDYLVLALEEETADQAVVGSVVWAFRWFKKPRCREVSARGYALYSVCPLSFTFHKSIHLSMISAGRLASGCQCTARSLSHGGGLRFQCVRPLLRGSAARIWHGHPGGRWRQTGAHRPLDGRKTRIRSVTNILRWLAIRILWLWEVFWKSFNRRARRDIDYLMDVWKIFLWQNFECCDCSSLHLWIRSIISIPLQIMFSQYSIRVFRF